MNWQSRLSDVLYLNFAVNQEEVERLLPPETTVDSRLHRGEPWGVFSLVLFRHDPLRPESIGWPQFRFPQVNLRIYVKDSDGTPSVYFKQLYMSSLRAFVTRWYTHQPVTAMTLNFPARVHDGGEYRWNLSDRGEGNIAGKVGRDQRISGNLLGLFDSEEDFLQYIRQRPLAYYSAGMDYVYRVNVSGDYGEYRSFQVKEWELGFLADDLERHNFPEAMTANFCCPEMELSFGAPGKEDLSTLTRI
jgi:hypothetical protein